MLQVIWNAGRKPGILIGSEPSTICDFSSLKTSGHSCNLDSHVVLVTLEPVGQTVSGVVQGNAAVFIDQLQDGYQQFCRMTIYVVARVDQMAIAVSSTLRGLRRGAIGYRVGSTYYKFLAVQLRQDQLCDGHYYNGFFRRFEVGWCLPPHLGGAWQAIHQRICVTYCRQSCLPIV